MHFFGQKICTIKKIVLPLHHLFKTSAKMGQKQHNKTTTKNAQTIQQDCKTSAKIIQKFDTYKQISNKIPKKDFLQHKKRNINT